MKEDRNSALSDSAWNHLKKEGSTDLLVGISSYNNAHTINYVIHQAAAGLSEHFPQMKSTIFVSDGGSKDGTLDTAKAMKYHFDVGLIPVMYRGISGKGSAVKAIFEAARYLEAKAVALVDSDLRSITPEWIRLLIEPTLNGTSLVTPFYIRHKYDGTITNFICYPVTTSLYGKDIRQPIGGDFGLSNNLVLEILESPLWRKRYVRQFGIDIFETHTALAKGHRVKQACLGVKIHEAKDPSKQLAPMFRQVVGSMFSCIGEYENSWRKIRGLDTIDMVGDRSETREPEEIQVDLVAMIDTYSKRFDSFEKIYESVLGHRALREMTKLARSVPSQYHLTPEAWAETVYDFIVSFKKTLEDKRNRLIDAFRVLWIGKVASFVQETLEMNTAESEKKIKEETHVFLKKKPHLTEAFFQ